MASSEIRMKRQLLHEWMHRFEVRHSNEFVEDSRPWTVRVWTQASSPDSKDRPGEFARQHKAIEKALHAKPVFAFIDAIDLLKDIDYVSAIEALDADGNGSLVYVDWP